MGHIGINECFLLFDKDLKNTIGGLDTGNFESVKQLKTIDEILSMYEEILSGKYDVSILADRISNIRFI